MTTPTHEAKQLAEDKIYVWQIPFNSPGLVDRLRVSLTKQDIEQSARFHFEVDRRHYLASRGSLRAILALHLRCRPADLIFANGKFGKPYLTSPPAARKFQFNLSHSLDMGLIAVSLNRRVGIDIETIREIPELEAIAEDFFTAKETQMIAAAKSNNARIRIFLTAWTRREATIKALGYGLDVALARIPDTDDSALLTRQIFKSQAPRTGPTNGWFLQDLRLDSLHVAALCAEGTPCNVVIADSLQSLDSAT